MRSLESIAAIAVARQAEPAMQPQVLAALDGVDPQARQRLQSRSRRAYQLAMIRLGEPVGGGEGSKIASQARAAVSLRDPSISTANSRACLWPFGRRGS
jgi:hypothetical protein